MTSSAPRLCRHWCSFKKKRSPFLSLVCPAPPRTDLCPATHCLIRSKKKELEDKGTFEDKGTKICNLPLLPGRWSSVGFYTEIQKWVGRRFDDGIVFGQKRSTCDRRRLFQDHFKAVMLAHQYDRVSRIAWLCS